MVMQEKLSKTRKEVEEITVYLECWVLDPPGLRGPSRNYIILI